MCNSYNYSYMQRMKWIARQMCNSYSYRYMQPQQELHAGMEAFTWSIMACVSFAPVQVGIIVDVKLLMTL